MTRGADEPLSATPPAVTGVAQVAILVADLDRAVDFYRDRLGLPLWLRVDEQRMAFLLAGDTRIYLQEAQGERAAPAVYLRTASVRSLVDALRAGGVDVVTEAHVVHAAGGTEHWLAFVADGEGNTIGLMSEEPG